MQLRKLEKRNYAESSETVVFKEAHVVKTAVRAWLETVGTHLAEQVPNKATSGGASRSTSWRRGHLAMEDLRKDVLAKTVTRVKEELQRFESGAPEPVQPRLRLKGSLTLNRLMDLHTVDPEATDQQEDIAAAVPGAGPHRAGAVKAEVAAYLDSTVHFRFSCLTRTVLYGVLCDNIPHLPEWPRRAALEQQPDGKSQISWVPYKVSQSYFNKILKEFDNISFYKNPTFSKCNTCSFLRNLNRMRTNSRQQVLDIQQARTFHCNLVLSEVRQSGPLAGHLV
jgi:hypothetical protein